MKQPLLNHLLTKKITIAKWQLNVFAVGIFVCGSLFGLYVLGSTIVLPTIFASTTPWTQTDWSGGSATGTVNVTVSTFEAKTDIATDGVGELIMQTKSSWPAAFTSWGYRKKITFDNTDSNLGVTSENLTNFPVLIKLTGGLNIDYTKTQNSGQDVRFTDSDGTPLSYEIEKWDETGTSYVWVKVPQIDANSNTDSIYVYYGNTGASDGQNPTNVWDSNYVGVWHMEQDPSGVAPQMLDSTSNNNDGTSNGSMTLSDLVTGQISNGVDIDNSNDHIGVAHNGSLLMSNAVTFEAWVNVRAFNNYQGVLTKGYGSANSWGMHIRNDLSLWVDIGASACNRTDVKLQTNTWQYTAGIYDGSATKVMLQGLQVGASCNVAKTIGNTEELRIGRMPTYGTLNGVIDEVRVSNVARSAAWIAASFHSGEDDFVAFETEEISLPASASLTSNVFDAEFFADWGALGFTTSGSGGVEVRVRSDANSDMSTATDWASCAAITSGTDLTTTDCVDDTDRYLQYQVTLTPSGASSPVFEDINIAFSASDQVAPTTNASNISMATAVSGGRAVAESSYNNATTPYFSWTAGADDPAGNGLKGYCVYLGTTVNSDPRTAAGLLTNSPVISTGTDCGDNGFIVSNTSLNLAASSYLSSPLISGTTYYLYLRAIDLAGNAFSGTNNAEFSFIHDGTAPTNISYLSTPGSSFSNVVDMFFSWPTSGGTAASDDDSGILGYQYQLNGTAGTWLGTQTDTTCGFDYIPSTDASYTLTQVQDGGSIVSGNNIVYVRTVDTACNVSSAATYRTGNLSYGGAAPAFSGDGVVMVTPSSAAANQFALSWPEATATAGQVVTHYYYMINTAAPSTLATLQSNPTTYIDVGTNRTVASSSLANVNKGANTVRVVAIDDAATPNYSPSNVISGTFTLNSTDPDNVGDLVASDSSIKSQEQWNVTLTWTAPTYQGAGNLTYLIYRSSDGISFSQVGSTVGVSYVDNTPVSTKYYYKIYTKDGAQAVSSGTNAVTLTPTGKWTTPPTLESDPTVTSITTKKATITWSTSRSSDTKIQFGISSGDYNAVEPSSSDQVAAHTIELSGLEPGTTYYYKAKWTDEDGNTGESDEQTFSTSPAPNVKDVEVTSVSVDSALVNFTVTGANSVKLYYGTSTSFGGLTTISTSTSETAYSLQLSGLLDGTKYYYKINAFDTEGDEYEGTTLNFTTLPRPKITQVQLQQVTGTAQTTLLVSWLTNTPVSSIVTYYPPANPGSARDEVNVALKEGEHQMLLTGLLPDTSYVLVVKGIDQVGNQAVSDPQTVTTQTDTRPPQVTGMKVEGGVLPAASGAGQESTAQLVISWNTDEPATSQVEYGEGTGTTYSQKTQEDTNLTVNHLVVISNLTPSKVYHVKAVSQDKAGNEGSSIDTVSITPKATRNALDLVMTNLGVVFGFLGGGG